MMSKKMYKFNYNDYSSECTFIVDLDKFTTNMALNTLNFFSWEYDHDNDPIDEVMIKYAKNCIIKSSEYSLYGIKNGQFEGFYKLNGEYGITIVTLTSLEIKDNDLKSDIEYV